MSRPTFLQGVAVAAVASLSGGVLFYGASLLAPGALPFRLTISALAGAYLLYLLRRSPRRSGTVASVALWIPAAILIWWLAPLPSQFLAFHAFGIWFIRAFHYQTGPLTAAADLCLALLGLAAGTVAMLWSGSIVLSIWCFFLIQALFPGLAPLFCPMPKPGQQPPRPSRFNQAYSDAASALRRL